MEERVELYTDGASRGNPGKAGCGAIVVYRGKEIELKEYIGEATNNIAEYKALLLGLNYIKNNIPQIKEISIFSDSELVVKQLKREYKVKNNSIIPLYMKVINILSGYDWEIKHIPREKNKKADRLANLAINEHNNK